MKAGRVFDIGMPEWHSNQIVPLEVNDVPVEFFGDHEVTGNLTGETRIPERRKELRRRLLRHDLDYVGCRNKAGVWESLQNGPCAEEVVAVAVRRVDRCHVLAARRYPIRERAGLLDRDEGRQERRRACRRSESTTSATTTAASPLGAGRS